MIAYLGLGSNLGDRLANLRAAVEALRAVDASLVASSVYETAPVGGPEQGPYLNCVVRIQAEMAPEALLCMAQDLEANAARVRTVTNGPRTLDVDILLIDDLKLDRPELIVPHPRMYERGFVLVPLEEIAPSLVPPRWRETIPDAAALATNVRRVGTLSGS